MDEDRFNDWLDFLLADAREIGLLGARIENMHKYIGMYLTQRFGLKSFPLVHKVMQIYNLEILEYIFEELFDEPTIDQVNTIINNAMGNKVEFINIIKP